MCDFPSEHVTRNPFHFKKEGNFLWWVNMVEE
jgi:hypothetical protein